eukprot:scaffold1558_cov403-Prasinococcus_capsulatus_cf.AAC.9
MAGGGTIRGAARDVQRTRAQAWRPAEQSPWVVVGRALRLAALVRRRGWPGKVPARALLALGSSSWASCGEKAALTLTPCPQGCATRTACRE